MISLNHASREGLRSGILRGHSVNIEYYPHLYELMDDLKRRPVKAGFDDESKESMTTSWNGVSSYSEALGYLESGYQANVDSFEREHKPNVTGIGKRYTIRTDVVGCAPVVPLALIGVPESMVRIDQTRIKTKVIDVYCDMKMTGGYSASTYISNGSKLLAVLMSLESSGYRTNLYVVHPSCGDGSCDVLVVKVKDSNRALDIKRMSFALMHPAFFRVIGFDWYSKYSPSIRRFGYGSGFAFNYEEHEINEAASSLFGENSIIICGKHIIEMSADEIMEKIMTRTQGKRASEKV